MGPSYNKLKVVILTNNYRILGEITIAQGMRLTDHIIRAKSFFAVTDAEVLDKAGNRLLTASFLDVYRESVEIIVPDEPNSLLNKVGSRMD